MSPQHRPDRALSELLLEPYELDPGALEFLLEEALKSGADGPVKVLLAGLAVTTTGEIERKNLAAFVRLAAQEPPVRRRLEKSFSSKWGRCPRQFRAWLSGLLEVVEAAAAPPKAVREASRALILDLSTLRCTITEIPILLSILGTIPEDTREVELCLGEFTYASGLAVIAEFLIARGLSTSCSIRCPPGMKRYLDRIGFEDVLRQRKREISPDHMDWAVGMTRIDAAAASDAVSRKIVDIIDTFVNLGTARGSLFILVSEMIENVHRHARATKDGIAVAQVYPGSLRMGITFVDAGIGIRQSFLEGDPTIPVDPKWSDATFLRRACELGVTSKSTQHSGYGLYLLSRVVANNRGTFLLSSGSASLVGYLRGGGCVFDTSLHNPWQGTVVSVVIDLQQKLSTLDVYNTMPPIEEWRDDEIFE